MAKCDYCLCKVCNKVRCPRGRFHCIPCYHGQVLECDFFMHKQVVRTYRVKHRSPVIHADQLVSLRDTINQIIGCLPESDPDPPKTLRDALDREELRHRQELKKIINKFK